ncbi:hypothetical protein KUTeg_014796, partial [Tegillarca granosa]
SCDKNYETSVLILQSHVFKSTFILHRGERPGSETGTSVLQMGQGKVLGLFTSALEVLNTEREITLKPIFYKRLEFCLLTSQ